MQIPGTNIEVSLKVNRVSIVDGVISRRLKYTGRSFKEVMEDVQRFAYLRGFNVPQPILKFILKRIGLPEVDIIPGEEELTKDDLLELARALNVIESLKDEFLSPTGKLIDSDDIKISLTSELPIPQELKLEVPAPQTMNIWDVPLSEEVTGLVYSFHAENIPTTTPTPRTQSSENDKPVKFVWDMPDDILPVTEMPETDQFSAEPVSNLFDLKVLFLGEDGVGVNSIIFESNLKLGNEYPSLDIPPTKPFTYSNIVEHNQANVRVDAWTFQKSIDEKIPKTEFYTGAGIVVIVYSVAERWSFESLDFWIKEVSNVFLIPPPMIIVGNKTDLRDHPVYDEEDDFEVPVTTEEARAYCEKAAKSMGENGQSHPLFFMETSTITGEGIADLLNKIVDFWSTNERPSMPATEQHAPTH
ncbi:MAG: hypothetical protein ACFFF9_15625 [Candidatus Thorarchaeota archaeon]